MQSGSINTWLRSIGITTLVCAGMGAGALAWAGCGASRQQAREAREAVYDAPYAVVYTEVLAAVQEQYPDFVDEDAARGRIRTPWLPVRLASQGTLADDTPGAVAAAGHGTLGARYFVRFDIAVIGDGPWQVQVHGQASSWEQGQALPVVLTGKSEPMWLEGRVDALQVAIHERLAGYAVARPRPAPVQAAPRAEVEAVPDVGDIPAAAARAVRAALAAARAQDLDALAAVMREDFTWSLGAPPDAAQALRVWRADPAALDALVVAIEAGCGVVSAGRDGAVTIGAGGVVCPAAASQGGHAGYRAGFTAGADGRWKMSSFLVGD